MLSTYKTNNALEKRYGVTFARHNYRKYKKLLLTIYLGNTNIVVEV